MNTNITSLQTIVGALQNNDYVTNIAPITEGNKTIGYTISFSKSNSITIYLGGDASALQIGVKQHSDGLYYWTLGVEWLIDDSGNKVKAQGNMPMLKIENDYWYVSYDNGTTWSEMSKVTSGNSDLMFDEVTYDDDCVYLTLSDGTTLILPRRADFTDIPANEIWYTTINGSAITLSYPDVFGAKIISNVYEKSGKGIITFDGDVTSIGNRAFYECSSLTSITLPDSVTSIGNRAFYECSSLISMAIPEGVLSIGYDAFYSCIALTSITLPESITEIGYDAFMYCSSLTAFYGKYASADNRCLIVDGELNSFAPAGLTSYTIPDSVTSIGSDAFNYCYSLESITLPDSVTSIGNWAFYFCPSLTTVYSKNPTPPTPPTWSIDSLPFYYCENLKKIYVPTESVDAYKTANGWENYASKIEGYDFSN